MMMAAMKAKQGILNTGNILDIVCEGAEVGASFPGDAGFPENVEFSVGRVFREYRVWRERPRGRHGHVHGSR